MNLNEARSRIERAFRSLTTAQDSSSYSTLLPASLTSGKLYEAFILGKVAEKLVTVEGYSLTLINSNHIALKSSPGPVNRQYPRIDVVDGGRTVAELWTDVEFLSLSYDRDRSFGPPSRGDFHELDLLVVDPGISGYPRHSQIWLGIECKNTGYSKGLLREILGVRRELSLLDNQRGTRFRSWPRQRVPANPPSCLVVYTTDSRVNHYASPGETFGIDFVHQELKP